MTKTSLYKFFSTMIFSPNSIINEVIKLLQVLMILGVQRCIMLMSVDSTENAISIMDYKTKLQLQFSL